jgi:hypothetical protein
MSKTTEAVAVLKELGLPRAQQNERSALTLLALLDLRENAQWSESRRRIVRVHDVLVFVQEHYGKRYAENTRETIRRQTIHQFEQAGIVMRNPDDPSRATNSPKNVYEITDPALAVIKQYGTPGWMAALRRFIKEKGRLIDRYEKRKKRCFKSVNLPDGASINLSPGKHNELQIKIIQELRPRFCAKAKVLYVGDAARKLLYRDEKCLTELNIPITRHDKLPDVVLYDPLSNRLFLIEAVTAHGPISPKRQIELEQVLEKCKARRVYISAFPDFAEFKRHIDNIAWETEVWIEINPDHMIHFNGPKFMTVYGD